MRRVSVLVVLAMVLSVPLGAMSAVSVARSEVAARGGDPGDGIGLVIPALSGAVAAVLLVLLILAAVLVARAHPWQCARAARGVVLVPVLAALPVLALLLAGSLLAAVVAVLAVAVTGGAAGAVWRSTRVGLGVLVVVVVAVITVVAVLGVDSVVLLLPHLLLSVGCWAVAAMLLASAAHGGPARPTSGDP